MAIKVHDEAEEVIKYLARSPSEGREAIGEKSLMISVCHCVAYLSCGLRMPMQVCVLWVVHAAHRILLAPKRCRSCLALTFAVQTNHEDFAD